VNQAVVHLVLVAFVCAAAWWDFTTQRIPNTITVAGLAAALILRAPLGGDVIVEGLAGMAFAFVAGAVLYALGGIGGGDVKLLAGVGAFLGSAEVLGALCYSAILGAVFALLTVIRRGLLPLLVLNTLDLVKSWRSLGRAGQARRLDSPAAITVPYGVPIALGTLLWWFGKGVRL
jgi:prepilin peptidase CpaA